MNNYTSDEKRVGRVKQLLQACKNVKEEKIIRFRLGLEDGISKTLHEVAGQFGITRDRAMQIEKNDLQKNYLASQKKKDNRFFE